MPEALTEGPVKDNRKQTRLRLWLKRLGIAGFLFFLIKGLVWLAFGTAILGHLAC